MVGDYLDRKLAMMGLVSSKVCSALSLIKKYLYNGVTLADIWGVIPYLGIVDNLLLVLFSHQIFKLFVVNLLTDFGLIQWV